MFIVDFHTMHAFRRWYKVFCTIGCKLDGVRYSGKENCSLGVSQRAKRFSRYIKECCYFHHGRDVTYLKTIFFRKNKMPKKRARSPVSTHTFTHSLTHSHSTHTHTRTLNTKDSESKDKLDEAAKKARSSVTVEGDY